MTNLEQEAWLMLMVLGVKPPVQEYRFHPKRKWRFDFAWPQEKVALEVEGGIWNQGRHNRAKGFIGDCEKYNEAILHGWRVLRITAKHVRDAGYMQDIMERVGLLGGAK